ARFRRAVPAAGRDRGPDRADAAPARGGLDRRRVAGAHGDARTERPPAARRCAHGRCGRPQLVAPEPLAFSAMQATEKIWMNGELVDWDDAKVHVGAHGLHYGTGVFEGIRCYDTPKGPAVFRLTDHMQRMHYSARLINMELPFSVEELRGATNELLGANSLHECYIRPIAFFVVRGGAISTPGLETGILHGITRDSVIQIANDLGYTVTERTLIRSDLYLADEVFMCGTAAEVTPVRSVDDHEIGVGPVTLAIQKAYLDTVHG